MPMIPSSSLKIYSTLLWEQILVAKKVQTLVPVNMWSNVLKEVWLPVERCSCLPVPSRSYIFILAMLCTSAVMKSHLNKHRYQHNFSTKMFEKLPHVSVAWLFFFFISTVYLYSSFSVAVVIAQIIASFCYALYMCLCIIYCVFCYVMLCVAYSSAPCKCFSVSASATCPKCGCSGLKLWTITFYSLHL